MSFFDEFNHIVPYFIKINVGKDKQFKTDANKKSYFNHKGKMVATYKKAETLEELEQHGLGEYIEYVPAEQVSMPIDIQLVSDAKLTPIFEKTSKYTNKKITSHHIRIFNSDEVQVGYVLLSLTPSGDITEKTSFYESPDDTERIMHTVYNRMKDGKLIKDDNFEFKKNNEKGTKKIQISQRDGKVVGCSVLEQDLETKEDIMFQSITEFSIDEKTPKIKRYVESCVNDEIDVNKRDYTGIPWECMTLENDLLKYQKAMSTFQEYAKRYKEETGIEFSIKKAIEIGKMSYDEQRRQGFSPAQIDSTLYYSKIAKYLEDESNDRLKNFKGDYIGNILKLTDKGYEACIVTKHQKDGCDYRLYTLIDFSGASITNRDSNYFEKLDSSDKIPTFVTRIDKVGQEELVLYGGKAVSRECPEYDEFVKDFISPFSEITPMQISKILNKQNEKDR